MKKIIRLIVPLMLSLAILASIAWYLLEYDRSFTRDTLLSQARFHDLHGSPKTSSWFYNLAYTFSGHEEDVAVELANQYRSVGNFTKAEATLTKALQTSPSVTLYKALCETFVAQNKLLDAVRLLDGIADPAIAAQIASLRPSAPAVDYAPGYYSQYMDIHLSTTGKTIYYSMDGQYPSTDGNVYAEAITLPTGETTIKAISVGNDGLVSTVSTMDYTITGIVEEVTFVDPAVEQEVRQLIHAGTTETLYSDKLWSIKEFTAPDNAVVLDDIQKLSYLENLTIHNHTLDSLEFLKDLNNLNSVDLTGCNIPADELTVLANLPKLSKLTLADCSLSTISALAGADHLSYLDLSHNTLRNLEVLTPMTSLIELNLQHNALTDLSALSGLMGLEKLNVGFNSISDLSPLSKCGGLSWLDAANNKISSLGSIASLPLLKYLSVEYNSLSDISVLAGCTGLTELSIASNTISDISMLKTLTKLEVFDFSSNHMITSLPQWPDGSALRTIDGSYNALTSIDSLKNMRNLSYVYMDYNQLTNIDAIADCYCLVQVNVFGNKIPDVSKLRSHDIIVNYDPTAA